MGFSVSGATAIILLGLFIAFAMAYPTVMSGFEQLGDARDEQHDRILDTANAGIAIEDADYDEIENEVSVNVTNTGTVSLHFHKTDVLHKGEYVHDPTIEAKTDVETAIWLPGETVEITIDDVDDPGQVVIVTEFGVATSTEVNDG